MLLEMHTLLQLPIDTATAADIELKQQLNYQCAPSDPANVPLYNFLAEKWGV